MSPKGRDIRSSAGFVQSALTPIKLYDDAAERSVLGAILLNPEMATSLVSDLRNDDFFVERNRTIFRACQELYDEGTAIDSLSITDKLERKNLLATVGGAEYVADLCLDIPLDGVVRSRAGMIRDYCIIRNLHSAAQEIITDISQSGEGANALLGRAEQKIFSIGTPALNAEGFVPIGEFVKVGHADIKAMIGRGSALTGLSTGFGELDHFTTGLHAGQLIIIAARPSIGKTSLALNMAERMGENGHAVGFFSLEMSGEQLAMRMISTRSKVPVRSLLDGLAPDSHLRDIDRAAKEITNMPLFVDDRAGLTAREVRATARRLKKQHNIKAIFVDYLQLMTGDGDTREREVAYISSELKGMAKELGVPVIALSQLNRRVVDREGPPRLSDLRESGAIEQDSDMVLFLHDPKSQHGEIDGVSNSKRVIQLIIGKQRNGPRVNMELEFDPSTTRFETFGGKPAEEEIC